ncbi:MAG: DUF3089 domain-containing protein [Myxococcales bacterium]|nr:DUF3089 domain-containing protein [Myxococcales bacterium]
MGRRLLLALAVAGLLGLGYGGCNTLRRCAPDPDEAPDYASADAWACRPDVDGDACDIDLTAVEVLPDGSTQLVDHVPAADPAIDCFYVYPTVDLRLRAGLHHDIHDDDAPRKTAGIQAARFSEVCRVYAPLYRQVTVGTYVAREEVREFCFDAAFADVEAAFDHYLEHDNQGRGFVLIGHSQGAQIVSRLVRKRIDNDDFLRGRLVAALPIGWPLGTDAGGVSGGSFARVPVCRADDELGCVVGFRSFAAQNKFPSASADFAEGPTGVCVHPGDVAGGGPAPLTRSFFPADLGLAGEHPPGVAEMAPFVLYRDLYSARCEAEGDAKALAVSLQGGPGDARTSPLDLSSALLSGDNGTHVYDMHMTLGDLIDLVGVKAGAYPVDGY